MMRVLARMASPRDLEEELPEPRLLAGASALAQCPEKLRMRGAWVVSEDLADKGTNIVVRHFLARVLGHGRTPFERPFELSLNGLHAEPVCGFAKDLLGQARMKRCPRAAKNL